jgi:hypothetical protein
VNACQLPLVILADLACLEEVYSPGSSEPSDCCRSCNANSNFVVVTSLVSMNLEFSCFCHNGSAHCLSAMWASMWYGYRPQWAARGNMVRNSHPNTRNCILARQACTREGLCYVSRARDIILGTNRVTGDVTVKLPTNTMSKAGLIAPACLADHTMRTDPCHHG